MWGFRRSSEVLSPVGHHVCELTADEFETGELEALLIRAGWVIDVDLRLMSGSDVLQSDGPHTTSSTDGRWAFDLGRFTDTVRTATAPQLGLVVTAGDVTVEVASIDVDYVIEHLEVDATPDPDTGGTALVARFRERRPFRHRELRLWPADHVGGRPEALPIPDDARTEVGLTVKPDVPAGRYLGELAVGDAWRPMARPVPGRSYLPLVLIGTEAERAERAAGLDLSEARSALEARLGGAGIRRDFTDAEARHLAGDVLQLLVGAMDDHGPHPIGSLPFRILVETLFQDSDVIAPVVETAVVNEVLDHRDGMRLALAVVPDALDCPPQSALDPAAEAAWSVSPALGAALDPPRWGIPGPRDRWLRFTGWDPSPLVISLEKDRPLTGLPTPGWPVGERSPKARLEAAGDRESRFVTIPTTPLPLNDKGFARTAAEWQKVAHATTRSAAGRRRTPARNTTRCECRSGTPPSLTRWSAPPIYRR